MPYGLPETKVKGQLHLSDSSADFLFYRQEKSEMFLILICLSKAKPKGKIKKAVCFNKMEMNIFPQFPNHVPRNSRVPQ